MSAAVPTSVRPGGEVGDGSDDLAWLQGLLGVDGDGPPVRYLARPSAAEPRLLIPIAPPRAAAAAMTRLHGDRALVDSLTLLAGRALARTGRLARAPGEEVVIPRFALVDELGRRLGEPGLTAAITIGPPRRNRKPVLQLVAPDGRSVGFAKVGWSPLTHRLVADEVRALRAVEGALPSAVVAPAVIAELAWGDTTVAVTSTLRPRGLGRSTPDVGRVAAAVAAVDGGRRPVAELPLVTDGLGGDLARTVDLGALVDRAADHELRTGWWHGDCTPWNMVARGGRTHVWDWEFAAPQRPVGFDLLHHRFEQRRRRPGVSAADALGDLLAEADDILIGSDAPRGRRPEACRTIVDLYLCELLARELSLDGQRWSGGELATLGPALVDALAPRLA
ncbi:MAG: hypothetical protein AAGE88_23570 [Actinomycetota bacterium]